MTTYKILLEFKVLLLIGDTMANKVARCVPSLVSRSGGDTVREQSLYDLRTSITWEEQVAKSTIKSHFTQIWDVIKAVWNLQQLQCLEKHVIKGWKFYPKKKKKERARKYFKQGNDNIRFGI